MVMNCCSKCITLNFKRKARREKKFYINNSLIDAWWDKKCVIKKKYEKASFESVTYPNCDDFFWKTSMKDEVKVNLMQTRKVRNEW